MPVAFYLAFMGLLGLAIFTGVVLVFRLSNHDWPYDDE